MGVLRVMYPFIVYHRAVSIFKACAQHLNDCAVLCLVCFGLLPISLIFSRINVHALRGFRIFASISTVNRHHR